MQLSCSSSTRKSSSRHVATRLNEWVLCSTLCNEDKVWQSSSSWTRRSESHSAISSRRRSSNCAATCKTIPSQASSCSLGKSPTNVCNMHLSKSNEALRRLDTGLGGLGFPVDVGRSGSRVVAEARRELAALLPSILGNDTPVRFAHSLDSGADSVVPALLQRRREGCRRVVGRNRARERRRGLLLRKRGSNKLGRSAEPAGWSAQWFLTNQGI